jgi:hypothetical protein
MTPTGSEPSSATNSPTNDLGIRPSPGAANSDVNPADSVVRDQQLAAVVALWPTLTESVKAALLQQARKAAGTVVTPEGGMT